LIRVAVMVARNSAGNEVSVRIELIRDRHRRVRVAVVRELQRLSDLLRSQERSGLRIAQRGSLSFWSRDPARVEHFRIEMRRASVGAFTATA
jgi:hypothetical protein